MNVLYDECCVHASSDPIQSEYEEYLYEMEGGVQGPEHLLPFVSCVMSSWDMSFEYVCLPLGLELELEQEHLLS